MREDGSITLGRNPYGPADKEVLVFKVTTTDGKPLGAIFDYATHSTSLGPRNMLISGDVLGISAQFVEKILGEEVVSPVFAGASGDIDPWYRILPGFNTESGGYRNRFCLEPCWERRLLLFFEIFSQVIRELP